MPDDHGHPGRRRRVAAALGAHDAVDDGHADAGEVAELHAVEDVLAGRMLRLVHDDEVSSAADFVIMDRAQHSPGKTILESVQLGDLPGIGMTIIDGIVRTQRSRNTPPATKVPVIVGH